MSAQNRAASSSPNAPYPQPPRQPQPPAGDPRAAFAGAVEPERHQVHSSYVWLGSLRATGAIVAALVITQISALAGVIFGGEKNALIPAGFPLLLIALMVMGVVVVIFGAVMLYQFLSYKHVYFTLSDDEFNVYKGILNKTRVHVPYRRVQSVDQRATLLQRVFGVCSVSIDTAGGSANKAITVPYLTKHQAEWLRRELFARKRWMEAGGEGAAFPADAAAAMAGASAMPAGAPAASTAAAGAAYSGATFGNASGQGNILDAGAALWQEVGGLFAGDAVDTGRVTYEYGLSNKELVLTGLSNNSAFVLIIVGIIGVFSQIAEFVMGLFPRVGETFAEGVATQASDPLGAGLPFFGILALSLIAGAVVLWLFGALFSCIGYGGFRARRRDNRIEVERGLLQHTFQGVDIDRVQSVTVKQTFIRRLLGYCEISLGKIDAAAESSDGSQQSGTQQGVIIHPFVKVDCVPEILEGMLPEYQDVPREVVPVASVALRRALIRRCTYQGGGFWLALCVALTQVSAHVFMGVNATAAAFGTTVEGALVILGYLDVAALVLYAAAVLLLALDAVGAVLWFRESSFAFNKRFMQVTNGGFSRETISFLRQKIQFGYVRTNPFQRAAGVATVNARTAAGVGGTTVRLIDARAEDAELWLRWLEPGGNVLQ